MQQSNPAKPKPNQNKTSNPKLMAVSILFRALVIIVILGAAGGIVKLMMASKQLPAHSDELLEPIHVQAITAQLQNVNRTWDGYGTARSMNDADIVAEVAGRVIERPVEIEPGQAIQIGTVLLRLDASDYANALEAATQAANALTAQINGLSIESERIGTQINYANDEIDAAQRDMDRTAKAIEAGAGNIGELDIKTAALRRIQRETESLKEKLELIPIRRAQLLAQLAAQRANAASAQKNLDRSVIRSPISGIIQSVNARTGDWVALGTPVLRIVDLSHIEIPIRLPASALSWIDLGHQVQLWAGNPINTPDQVGTITRIAPEVDPTSRTVTVFVEVKQDPDSDHMLSPGRFVLGRVSTPDEHQRFIIPRKALQDGRVMIAKQQSDGQFRIQVQPVSIAYSIDDTFDHLDSTEDQWTAIQSGLQGGELVVTSLLEQVSQGLIVRVIGFDPPERDEAQP